MVLRLAKLKKESDEKRIAFISTSMLVSLLKQRIPGARRKRAAGFPGFIGQGEVFLVGATAIGLGRSGYFADGNLRLQTEATEL